MKYLTIILFLFLAGCGQMDREFAKLTGKAESCIDGVLYIQFASGVTVKYLPNGNIAPCDLRSANMKKEVER